MVTTDESLKPKLERGGKLLLKPFIYRRDGWLSPKGFFRGCKNDQHDACAEYIVEIEGIKGDGPARFLLEKEGYVQINAGTVLTKPGIELTRKQVDKISQSRTKDRLVLSTSTFFPDLKMFPGCKLLIELGELTIDEELDVQEFISAGHYFRMNDSGETVKRLYDILTTGFEEVDYYEFSRGYQRRSWYRISPDRSFIVELDEHIHDRSVGIRETHWIRVFPADESWGSHIDDESTEDNLELLDTEERESSNEPRLPRSSDLKTYRGMGVQDALDMLEEE